MNTQPQNNDKDDVSYKVIADSIDYLVNHYSNDPSLEDLAKRAGYESTYFQKLFRDYVGVSPKRLVQYMKSKKAGSDLRAGASIELIAHENNFTGTGRVYDLFVKCHAVSPGQYKQKGMGVDVTFGFAPSQLGQMLVAQTDKGICYLGFVVDEDESVPIQKMKHHLPNANYLRDDLSISHAANQILSLWRGYEPAKNNIKLDIHGTNMQIQVWQALLKIPTGQTRTYSEIASLIGKPKAARAVGNAVGANPVSLIIPCHRVIRATGIIDNYGWGSPRKKVILGLEGAL